jgi:hypothetical protein
MFFICLIQDKVMKNSFSDDFSAQTDQHRGFIAPGGLHLDTECFIIDPSSLHLDTESLIIGPSSLHLDTKCLIIGPSSLHLDTECLIIDPSSLHLDTECLIIDPSSLHLDTESLIIDPGEAAFDPNEHPLMLNQVILDVIYPKYLSLKHHFYGKLKGYPRFFFKSVLRP